MDILGISIGCQSFNTLTRLFEGSGIDLHLWGISPFNPDTAKRGILYGGRAASIALVPLDVVLGFVTLLPVIPANGEIYSPATFVEQGVIAVWGRPLWAKSGEWLRLVPSEVKVDGILLAEEDEFVDNSRAEEFFDGVPQFTIGGAHCRFIVNGGEYVEALRDFGLYA